MRRLTGVAFDNIKDELNEGVEIKGYLEILYLRAKLLKVLKGELISIKK